MKNNANFVKNKMLNVINNYKFLNFMKFWIRNHVQIRNNGIKLKYQLRNVMINLDFK